MIDLGKVERRCKEVIENGYGKHPVIECASAECVMELITRLRQAEKDAERYRSANERAESLISYIDCEVSELVKNDYSRCCELDGIATETGYYLRAMKCEQ